MQQLQRLVSAYLDIAEDMAIREIPMTMEDWEIRLNRFIEAYPPYKVHLYDSFLQAKIKPTKKLI